MTAQRGFLPGSPSIRTYKFSSLSIMLTTGILGLCLASSTDARQSPVNADTSLSMADSLARLGAFTEARKLYKAIPETNRAYLAARIGIGTMLITEGRYNFACDEFGSILDVDTSNIAAHFYYAICNREVARSVFWILKRPYWNKAIQHFEWVLVHDSLYSDVLFQYALLQLQKKEYERAFDLGKRQAHLKPHDPQSQFDLFRLYRLFLQSQSESDAHEWFQTHPSDIALYFDGELSRRNGHLEDAKSAFQNLMRLKADVPLQPIDLSLSRVYYKEDRPDSGEYYYWLAVNEILSARDALFLFEDLKYCITTRELELYRSLATPRQYKSFFEAFWAARNPTPASQLNPRIAEHYRRLLFAETRYECSLFRQMLARPDIPIQDPVLYALNQEFDDRGLIYIRLGAPDQTTRTDIDVTNTYESWMYNETRETPKMIFDFHLLSMDYNEWRLAPVQWNRKFLEDRVTWDASYSDLLMAMNRDPRSLEAARLEDKARKFTEENLTAGLETDRHTWEEKIDPLQVTAALTTFRGEGQNSMVDISYSAPIATLASKMGSTPTMLKLEIGVAISNKASLPVWKRIDTLGIMISNTSTGAIVDLFRFNAPPDSYSVSLQILPLGVNLLGEWKSKALVPDYSSSNLSLSDVQFLLPSPTKNRYQIEGIKVIPSPFSRYPINQPLRVYIQAYNLNLDNRGKSSCTFEYQIARLSQTEGILEKFADLFKSKSKASISTKFSREADSTHISQYLPIALGDIDPGEYVLKVSVTDDHTKKVVERTRKFELFRREDYQ